MTIQDLKNKVSSAGGLQRSNRYYIEINGPVAPFDTITDASSTPTQYIAETVLFPNITMTLQADGLAGPGLGRQVPRGKFYKDGLLITFPVFQNWNLVKGLENWLEKMYYQVGGDGTWVTEYYNSNNLNTCQLKVISLDMKGNKTATYVFKEAYPIEIAPLQFSALETNNYLKIMVRFYFRDYNFNVTPPQS